MQRPNTTNNVDNLVSFSRTRTFADMEREQKWMTLYFDTLRQARPIVYIELGVDGRPMG